MSRRYMDCDWRGEIVRVTLGYDRPLDEFFLQVERVSSKKWLTGEFVYASSEDAGAFKGDLMYFATKLRELGVAIPGSFLETVGEDATERRANWIVEHLAGGGTQTIMREPES